MSVGERFRIGDVQRGAGQAFLLQRPEFDSRGDEGRWMDLLSGSSRFKEQANAGKSAETFIGAWWDELQQFVRDTQGFLLYGGPRT